MVTLESFYHVAVKVPDVDAAVDFYRRHLDGELADRGEGDGFEYASLAVADRHLYLFDRAPYEAAGLVEGLPHGLLHFGYVVDDLTAATRELEADGVALLMEPTPFDGTRMAFFIDPAGTRIELFEFV